uniref:Uncharacterized protein n=1 Tax=Rhizophora mucronata TaxID=61149 RepID=A0A2P2J6H5_RHIMU
MSWGVFTYECLLILADEFSGSNQSSISCLVTLGYMFSYFSFKT